MYVKHVSSVGQNRVDGDIFDFDFVRHSVIRKIIFMLENVTDPYPTSLVL